MSTKGFVNTGADWVAVLDAAADEAPDERTWVEGIIDALKAAFPRADAVGSMIVPLGPNWAETMHFIAPGWDGLRAAQEWMAASPASSFRSFMFPPYPVTTQREGLRASGAAMSEHYERGGQRARLFDCLATVSHPVEDVVFLMCAAHQSEVVLSKYERQLLARVALHLEAAFRARNVAGALKATIAEDGRVTWRDEGAPARDVLAAHARRVARARRRKERATPDALDLWPALLGGRYSVLPRARAARRWFDVVENAPRTMPMRALTTAEKSVLDYAARGLTVKLTSYALGASPTAVSSRLGRAAAKIGLASRLELVRLAATFASDERQTLPDERLSEAEREVLALLRRGLSNAEIARLRSRSSRTIANQIASLLRKTDASSRRELIARSR